MEALRTQDFSSATHNEKCVTGHTEKVENILTKISHKILCDIYITVFTMFTGSLSSNNKLCSGKLYVYTRII